MIEKPLRIYTEISPLIDGKIKNLSPILSAYWLGLSKDEILRGIGSPSSEIVVTADPAEADFFALPMIWSYYLWNGRSKLPEAISLADLAAQYDKPVVVWHKGDLVPVLPFNNALLFAPGLERSKRRPNQISCPVFIDDPTPLYAPKDGMWRKKAQKPSVGFCGFAAMGPIKTAWSLFQGIRVNIKSKFGRGDFSPGPIIPPTFLRAQALSLLSKDRRINSHFVIRDRYTGVLSESESSHVFFSNIYDNDYTLCVRGIGNWSYRFYQTLACGRIPIFVDTDCEMPLSSRIDWKKYGVWIDRSNIKHIGKIVADYHEAIDERSFLEMQTACRDLWYKHCTYQGFMGDLRYYLREKKEEKMPQSLAEQSLDLSGEFNRSN